MADKEVVGYNPSTNEFEYIGVGDRGLVGGDLIVSGELMVGSSGASLDSLMGKVQAMLVSRGITNVNAIAFSSNGGIGKKVQASYVTETRPAGRFLGDFANATAAWAANVGGIATVAGDYYWDTSNLSISECTTLNVSSPRWRGAQSYLPAECVAVSWVSAGASNEYLHIFDLTDPLMPVWMGFSGSVVNYLWTGSASASAFNLVSLVWDGLVLWAARGNGNGEALWKIDFGTDRAYRYGSSGDWTFGGDLSQRNTASGFKQLNTTNQIPSLDVRDVKVNWDGYVGVATETGVGVISPAGTAIKSASTALYPRVAILRDYLFGLNTGATPNEIRQFGKIQELTAGFSHMEAYNSTNPRTGFLSSATLSVMLGTDSQIFVTSAAAVDIFWPNSASTINSLIARVGMYHATPPMKRPGVMLLCSSVTGALAGTNLYTAANALASVNDLTGITAAGATLTAETVDTNGKAAAMKMVATAGGGRVYLTISSINGTVAYGKWNEIVFDAKCSVGDTLVAVSTDTDWATTNNIAGITIAPAGTWGERKLRFLAPASGTLYLKFVEIVGGNNSEIIANNIRVQECIADYSGLANHGTISGSLTATALATGAVALVSGFTVNTNTVEAPNPWQGVGTGDAWLCGVFKTTSSTSDERIIGIGYWDGVTSYNASVVVSLTNGSQFQLYATNDAGATSVIGVSIGVYDNDLVHTFIIRKTSTHYYVEVDGKVVGSVAVGSHGNLTFHANAKLFVGRTATGVSVAPNTSIALVGGGIATLTETDTALMHSWLYNLVTNKATLDEIPTRMAFNEFAGTVEMVGTTYQQSFRKGAIISSAAHGQGSTPVVACGRHGQVAVGGSTGLKISVPEFPIYEVDPGDVVRTKEFKFTGDSVLVDFALEPDWYPISVYEDGVLMESGSTKDYTIQDTGFYWFIRFAVAPGVVTVTILAEKRV